MTMNTTPWLSILIPVYNVAIYLRECIESVVSQCGEGIEIIVVDDCSTDNSFQLINELAATSKYPLKVIQHEKNGGISVTRNSLIAAATGEYLWFLDSDDALAKGAIAQLHKIVRESSPDLIMCDYQIWRKTQPTSLKLRQKEQHVKSFASVENRLLNDPLELFAGIYKKGKLHIWSKISKRDLWLPELKFPEGKYFEDIVISPQLALRAKTYFYSPSVWVLYRQREGSILASTSSVKVDHLSISVDNVLNTWLKEHPGMDAQTRFFFIAFCIKLYAFTIKDLKKIQKLDAESLQLYRKRFYENIGMNKYALLKQCLRYGTRLKLLKYWRFL